MSSCLTFIAPGRSLKLGRFLRGMANPDKIIASFRLGRQVLHSSRQEGPGDAVSRAGFLAILFGMGLLVLASSPVAHAEKLPCAKPSDIEQQGQITHRFEGPDAQVFIDAIDPGAGTEEWSFVMVLSGPDVFGGTVAIVGTKDCLNGMKFLGPVEIDNALRMVERRREGKPVSVAELERKAAQGDAEAEYHIGVRRELIRRGSGRALLTQAAEQNLSPAIISLGYLAGGLDYSMEKTGDVWRPAPDPTADRPTGYCWLRVGSRLKDAGMRRAATELANELLGRMSDTEKATGEELWAKAQKDLEHPKCK